MVVYLLSLQTNICAMFEFCLLKGVRTLVDSESDRTVLSDTKLNCTGVPFKSIKIYVNTHILLVFYIVVENLYL